MDKEIILKMRADGISYAKIAVALNIPVGKIRRVAQPGRIMQDRAAQARYANSLRGRCRKSLSSSRRYALKYGCKPCTASIEELESAFTGYCSVCGVSEEELGRRLNMDHNHSTGKFRGWVCPKCNRIKEWHDFDGLWRI